MFLVQDEVFFQAFGKGVYKIENGNSKLFLDAPEILDARVVNLFKIEQGYLVLTDLTQMVYSYCDGYVQHRSGVHGSGCNVPNKQSTFVLSCMDLVLVNMTQRQSLKTTQL